jgi:hypothetical protein
LRIADHFGGAAAATIQVGKEPETPPFFGTL